MARTTRLASSAGAAAAAADSQWFYSLTSLSNGKIPSLLPRQTKSPPLDSINSTILSSLFSTPAEVTSSYPENSTHESRVGVKFSQTDCKFGNLCVDEEHPSINRMEPLSSLYAFNLFLNRLAENKRYSDVFSHFTKMNSARLVPDSSTLNILLKCFCNANRVREGLVVMGKIVISGYSPNVETLTFLIKGFFIGSRVADAVNLFQKLEKFGCRPDVFACNTIIHELCRSGNTSNAITLLEEMVNANCQYSIGCKPNATTYTCIIESLLGEGKEDEARQLFFDMERCELCPDIFVEESLTNRLFFSGMLKGVRNLFYEMLDRGTRFDVNSLIHGVCRSGKMPEAIRLLQVFSGDDQYRISCEEGRDDEAMELDLKMHMRGLCPEIFAYISLMNGLRCGGKLKEARNLFEEMLVRGSGVDAGTFCMLVDVVLVALVENYFPAAGGSEPWHRAIVLQQILSSNT